MLRPATFVLNLVLPMALHLGILWWLDVDAYCRNNPGCMAGTPLIYILLFVTAPTFVLLAIAFTVQAVTLSRNRVWVVALDLAIALAPHLLLVPAFI